MTITVNSIATPLKVLISWFMKLSILGVVFYSFFIRVNIPFATLAVLAFSISLAPNIIEKNHKINLPLELDLLVTFALYLHIVLGEWARFYHNIKGYDWIVHYVGTAVVSILAFLLTYTLHYTRKLRLTLPFIAFFTVIFALAMGTLWEITEFTVDRFFGYDTQKGLNNTMWDLIFDLIGGVTTALLGVFYIRFLSGDEKRELVYPIRELLKDLLRKRRRKQAR